MQKTTIYRAVIYVVGLLVLAMGLTLNTKAGLGVSPIISVSYSISVISGSNFGNTTLGLYIVFVMLELVLHAIREYRYAKKADPVLEHANHVNRRLIFLMDILQIPLSLVFTRFLNLYAAIVPDLTFDGQSVVFEYTVRLLVLCLALLLTGIGAAMSLNMRIVPNPGDGIVQAIADCIRRDVGFTKNCFDVVNVSITVTISLLCTGKLHGIGIGTVLAVIAVGRTIAGFNHLTKQKLDRLAGLTENIENGIVS